MKMIAKKDIDMVCKSISKAVGLDVQLSETRGLCDCMFCDIEVVSPTGMCLAKLALNDLGNNYGGGYACNKVDVYTRFFLEKRLLGKRKHQWPDPVEIMTEWEKEMGFPISINYPHRIQNVSCRSTFKFGSRVFVLVDELYRCVKSYGHVWNNIYTPKLSENEIPLNTFLWDLYGDGQSPINQGSKHDNSRKN